jgi:nicotinate dehydrogenase subunit B
MSMVSDALAALARAACSRRAVLKDTGALIVGVSATHLTASLGGAQGPFATRVAHVDPRQLDAWLAIAVDGTVTAYTVKCEFGQGILTAQTQLVAEELSVPVARVRIIECDTAVCPDQGTTSGSQSTPSNFNARNLAQAAATAREALLRLAAARLAVPVEQLTIHDGVISARADRTTSISYGELVAGQQFNVTLSATAPRKPARAWTVLGQPVPRLDMAAMAVGQFEYVHNVRVLDMLHGRVVRPPAVGAALLAVDETSVRDMPGLVKVVIRNNFVGVVAERQWQAVQAAEKLKTQWTAGVGLPPQGEFYTSLRHQQPSRDLFVVNSQDVDESLAQAAAVIKTTYLHPYQAHASMGVSCAVADVRDGQATLWSATQSVYPTRSGVALLLGLPVDNVRVIYRRGAGCYGLNGADTVTYDAALLSQAVGRPVRVQLSRRDEMAWENYGQAYVIDQRIGVDGDGTIIAWDYEAWWPQLGNRPGYDKPGNVVTGWLAGFEPTRVLARPAGDVTDRFRNGNNAAPSYVVGCVGGACGGAGTVRSERVLSHTVPSPFFTGPLRSPARLQNTFAHECCLDEVAAHVQADPVAYRLRHLRDRRLIAVVQAVATAAAWETRPSPQPQWRRAGLARGRGIACVVYEGDNGYAGMVAEVEVEQATGRLQVTRFVVAQDCGPIANPDGLRAQIEGGGVVKLSV